MKLLPYLSRTAHTSVLTAAFTASMAVSRIRGGSSGPRIVRHYLERAGAAFVKVGQILATRYDLLPPEYCQELATLLDQLPPSDSELIRAAIEQDLGKPVEALFRNFDPHPLSSASVAQVHAAELPDGTRVVVKVKHPGLEERYRADLRNLRLFAAVVSYFGFLHRVDVRALAREFERLALEELDFLHEARNIHVLHRLLQQDDIDHHAPRVYLSLSGRSVITMERLEGIWVREIIAAMQKGDGERLAAWRELNITPERTSRLLFRSVLEQCFTHRIFHADPHAGNLVVMNGGTLGYVDFGMVGWMDERLWSEQYALNEALAREKIHQAYEALLDTLEPLPDIDLSHFETEVKTLLMEWLFATKVPGTPIQDRTSAALFLQLFDVIRRQGLQMRLSSLRLCRALMISDVICLKLYPDLDRMGELLEYFNERAGVELGDSLREELSSAGLYSTAVAWGGAVRALPNAAQRLVKRLPEYGRRYEEVWSSSERVANLLLRYLRTLALVVFAAALAGRLFGRLGGYWWAVAAGSLATVFLAGRILREFE